MLPNFENILSHKLTKLSTDNFYLVLFVAQKINAIRNIINQGLHSGKNTIYQGKEIKALVISNNACRVPNPRIIHISSFSNIVW